MFTIDKEYLFCYFILMLFLIENAIKANESFNVVDFISNFGIVGKLVLLTLLLFSILSWAVIFYKWKQINGELKKSKMFLKRFRGARGIQEKFKIATRYPDLTVAEIFRAAYEEASNQAKTKSKDDPSQYSLNIDSLERAMLLKLNEGIDVLENKVGFLATTASVTPFIGLFGTVWGIMVAFNQIGLQGSADLATVAPGISEALINTAAGLFAAIPAVIAYNYILKKIKEITSISENFILEIENIFAKIKY